MLSPPGLRYQPRSPAQKQAWLSYTHRKTFRARLNDRTGKSHPSPDTVVTPMEASRCGTGAHFLLCFVLLLSSWSAHGARAAAREKELAELPQTAWHGGVGLDKLQPRCPAAVSGGARGARLPPPLDFGKEMFVSQMRRHRRGYEKSSSHVLNTRDVAWRPAIKWNLSPIILAPKTRLLMTRLAAALAGGVALLAAFCFFKKMPGRKHPRRKWRRRGRLRRAPSRSRR